MNEKDRQSGVVAGRQDDSLPEITLEELAAPLQKACARAGWDSLMPVQTRAIPYLLAGRDIMVQSRTGSGKTGAFVLPILDRINPTVKACQVLVLAPTRELALQVSQEASMLGESAGIKSVPVYGGASYGPQLDAFREGVQIVVGTPGRILDHLLRRTLTLDKVATLVFDEADRMLSMGFYPDMKEIQSFLPRRHPHTSMWSATYPVNVIRLARQFLEEPLLISLSGDQIHVAETEHVYYQVPPMEKDRCLVRIIEVENPTSAIIFCNTKAMVHYVAVVLQRFGYDADELTADLTQRKREQVLMRARKGTLRFLVATDLAARGLDIQELSHVIQYEPPEDPEAYIHRAGRTGRAGATGVAVSLVAGMEQGELRKIARRFEIEMVERQVPSDEEVASIVAQRLLVLLEGQLRCRDKLQIERMERFRPLVAQLAGSEEGTEIMVMLLDDHYQPLLHAPTPQPEAGTPKPPASTGGPPKTRRRSGPTRRR